MHSRFHLSATSLACLALIGSASMLHAQGEQNALAAAPRTFSSQSLNQLRNGYPVDPLTGRLKLVIELADPASAEVYQKQIKSSPANRGRAEQAARSQHSRNQQAQKQLLGEFAARGIDVFVIYRIQSAYNGIAVLAQSDDLEKIRASAGVKALHPLVSKQPSNSYSNQVIRAGEMWQSLPGVQGQNIRVGIIDTGIDYLHKTFGGPGTGYENNVTTTTGDMPYFPSMKVAGGYDFCGDDYDAFGVSGTPIPQPDPDPMDLPLSHGSHVAATLAGYGVTQDGQTFYGPYDAMTSPSTMRIGPGVAPLAKIYALRVSNGGGTDLVAPALDWAVDPNGDGNPADHLDVVNISMGSNFGCEADPEVVAAQHAIEAGVSVVGSAGNAGEVFFVGGGPGVAEGAISVASSQDSAAQADQIRILSPASVAGNYIAAAANFGPSLHQTGPISASLVYPSAAGQNIGCMTFDETDTARFAGKIALIDRGVCPFVAKVNFAAAAGAVAVLIADNAVEDPFVMSSTGDNTTIPALMITKATGSLLKARLANNEDVQVLLDPADLQRGVSIDETRVDMLSSFSSRGPRSFGGALKPDLTAPGETIFSAAGWTGSEGQSLSGTSMACPKVAGAVACMRQLHPTWDPIEIKALLMNTASHDLFTAANRSGIRYSPARIGAGRLDLVNASQASTLAYDATSSQGVGVSFGVQQPVTPTTWSGSIRLENKSASPLTYTANLDVTTSNPGVAVGYPAGNQITVPANGSALFAFELSGDPSRINHSPDLTLSATQNNNSRTWVSEVSGFMVFAPAGSQTPLLRVPVHGMFRPASQMHAKQSELSLEGPMGTATLTLQGTHVNTGMTTATDIHSRVSAFELAETSPDEPQSSGVANMADLQFVGVGTDFRSAQVLGKGGAQVYFALATHGAWNTPSEVMFHIWIDSDLDGVDDYLLENANLGSTYYGLPDDVQVTVLTDLHRYTFNAQCYINDDAPRYTFESAPYNSRVLVMPVIASYIGLNAQNTRFNYRVDTTCLHSAGIVDASAVHTYDVARPGMDFSDGVLGVPMIDDFNNAQRGCLYDRAAYAQADSQGVLLFHHHNPLGSQAEVVGVKATADLSVKTTVDKSCVATAQHTTFTVTVRNNGPLTANNVRLEDTVATHALMNAFGVNKGMLTSSFARGFTANFGTLAPGEEASAFVVLLSYTPGIPFSNQAIVSADEPDSRSFDNSSIACAVVTDALKVWKSDDFTSGAVLPPGSPTGWSSFGFTTPGLACTDYYSTVSAYMARIYPDKSRFRTSGMISNQSEWLKYSAIGRDNYVRVKYYVYGAAPQGAPWNVIPNVRLRAQTRFAVNSMLEVLHHSNGDPAGQEYSKEFRPSSNLNRPSLYRVDFDPVDVPYLSSNANSEGVQCAFEAYSTDPQDYGLVGLTESSMATYPTVSLDDQIALESGTKIYAPTASDAGDLRIFNSQTDLSIQNLHLGTGTGEFASADTLNPTGTYKETSQGVTLDTTAVPVSPIVGIVQREFSPGDDNAAHVRIEPGRQYKVRFHMTSTQKCNRQAQIRLRARTCKFAWTQKYEIGGAWATGTSTLNANNSIAQQALPGIGCANPDKNAGEAGGWYTLILHTPLSSDIRAEQPGVPLESTMPKLTSLPGPGQGTPSMRDIRVGCDLVDTLSGGSYAKYEQGNFTIDRIEVRSFPLVEDGGY